jgi:hypothetical protein
VADDAASDFLRDPEEPLPELIDGLGGSSGGHCLRMKYR